MSATRRVAAALDEYAASPGLQSPRAATLEQIIDADRAGNGFIAVIYRHFEVEHGLLRIGVRIPLNDLMLASPERAARYIWSEFVYEPPGSELTYDNVALDGVVWGGYLDGWTLPE